MFPEPDRGTLASVNGTRLSYSRSGSGPALVFLHGGMLDRRMWRAQLEAFSKDFDVIAYDLRGFGHSETTPGSAFHPHDDLAALLDSLGIARAHLVGHSLGGRVALDFALAHPDRVQRLVLAAPGISGSPPNPEEFSWYTRAMRQPEPRGVHLLANAWLESDYLAAAMKRPELAPEIREWTLFNFEKTAQDGASIMHFLDPGAFIRLEELKPPTLVLIGDRDNPAMRANADLLARRSPQVTKQVFPGAGHVLNLERPEEFNRAVRAFLSPR